MVADAVPERTAFVCGAQRLSYRELDERATRLASALRACCVRRPRFSAASWRFASAGEPLLASQRLQVDHVG